MYMDYYTQRMFFSTCLTGMCVLTVIIGWLWIAVRAATEENEKLNHRLFTVSQNLQLAERMTGQPFYTSILDGAMACEQKERLYSGMRGDFYGHCSDMINRREKMPVDLLYKEHEE